MAVESQQVAVKVLVDWSAARVAREDRVVTTPVNRWVASVPGSCGSLLAWTETLQCVYTSKK